MKELNMSLILDVIKAEGPISRMDIAKKTELSNPAVSQLVAELLKNDIIEEVGTASSTGGRPARLVQLNSQSGFYIGVAVGKTRMTSAVVNAAGQIVLKKATATKGVDSPYFRLISLIRDTLIDTELSPESIQGIGIGVPGIIDPATQMVVESSELGWENLEIGAQLAQCFRLPVWVGNAMNTTVLGEKWRGLLRGIEHGAAVVLDDGVHVGMLLNGKVYSGKNGAAGRVGDWIMKQTELGALLPACSQCVTGGSKELDSVALRLIQQVAEQIGIVLANAAALLDLERIIISGELSAVGHLLLDPINDVLCKLVSYPPQTVMTSLKEDASILGAVDGVIGLLNSSAGLMRS